MTEQLTERTISTVGSVRYILKNNRYVVQLCFPDERAKKYWLTERQLAALENAFSQTPHGYSTAKVWVTGFFDARGYYRYCRVDRKRFEPPEQYDLSDLEEAPDEAAD